MFLLRCGKVVFLHLSVILSMGEGSDAPRQTPPWADTPLLADTPSRQTHPGQTLLWADTFLQTPFLPPRADTPFTTGRWLLQRTVRILLECILVFQILSQQYIGVFGIWIFSRTDSVIHHCILLSLGSSMFIFKTILCNKSRFKANLYKLDRNQSSLSRTFEDYWK